jgi:hypothetical protein
MPATSENAAIGDGKGKVYGDAGIQKVRTFLRLFVCL